ncbi:hypothetical protein FIBSPDRAFT_909454 [Athelia psychrophila]|uniref:Reverse transcriptase domain-containing protein n=1 Tax=Athelia psychrophila TaxID=1759441 RepID=A0A166NXD5_9AGAM|nr:hypothetical protein FIBSPDRAFT_915365 [Fibularhizoctonia sp. CBS 109695]KZP25468.1 hypothetical protein FIBSPDRAFT_909454 [Fibularhizoctonia sp. CBS 109695]
MHLKGFNQMCLQPIKVVVLINGQSCRARLDSGSLSDFMSTTICDQLQVQKEDLKEAIPRQLTCSGSSSKIHTRATANLVYQDINEEHVFDMCNLESYDLILGTPFMFQHKILLGLNPTQVVVNLADSLPIRGVQTVRLEANTTGIAASTECMCTELYKYAIPICKEASETPLPPLRGKGLDHEINLIDPNMRYVGCHTRCPEGLRPAWNQNRSDYVKCSRWVGWSGINTVPMFIMQKPTKDGHFTDVYLDDIVIYSDSAEDHMCHCKMVIDRLREHNFFLAER